MQIELEAVFLLENQAESASLQLTYLMESSLSAAGLLFMETDGSTGTGC